MKTCKVCGQKALYDPTTCRVCGFPFDTRTTDKAIEKARAFYADFRNRGGARGWFEIKTISRHDYLYARWKEGTISKSKYIGKAW